MATHTVVECQVCKAMIVPTVITRSGVFFRNHRVATHSVCPFCLSAQWDGSKKGWKDTKAFIKDGRVWWTATVMVFIGVVVARVLIRQYGGD